MKPGEVTRFLIERAAALGFHRAGVARVDAPTRYRAYRRWLADGRAGSMSYLSAPHQLAARRDLRALAAEAKSVLVVALAYDKGPDHRAPSNNGAASTRHRSARGFVARYARGADYHTVLFRRLATLADAVAERLGRAVASRPCVDSAPVLERDLGEAAGLGFVAKNTMLIAPGLGSYFVLGELLLDVDAEPTPSLDASAPRCGECRACLDACPTGAFDDAYVLDARKCVSYLTIEHRGVIDRELRPAIGAMVFGCDVCQQVCPYNAAAPDRVAPDPELAPASPERAAPDPAALLGLGANQLRRALEGTALRRAHRDQWRRNACVALGNSGDPAAIPPLEAALGDRSALVRGHAAWALGRLGGADALEAALEREADPYVRSEITAALAYSGAQFEDLKSGDLKI